MENFRFEHPLFLLFGLGVILLLYFFWKKEKHHGLFSSIYKDIQQVYGQSNIWYRVYKWSVIGIFLLFIILLAGPILVKKETEVPKSGIDMVIVFDLSYSMEAQDIPPSRMNVAKRVIDNFIEKIKGDRIGVVLFAGRPFASVPLTFDYGFLRDFFSKLSTSTINQGYTELQGTAMGDALLLGTKMLEAAENGDNASREKVMIVLTDGEANKGIDPNISLKLLKEKNIKTYTIGIGGDKPTYIEQIDSFGRKIRLEVGALDEKTLKNIATQTGGKYFSAQDEDTFRQVLDTIAALEKTEIKERVYSVNVPFLSPFLYALFVFFFLLFIAYFKNIKI